MQPTIDIRESRVRIERVENDSHVGADEAIGRSIEFREYACKTHGISQSEQRPTSSDAIQWESDFKKHIRTLIFSLIDIK